MKQVSNVKNSFVLSSPRQHPIQQRRSFSNCVSMLLYLCIALFVTSCQKESLQSISQSPDLLTSSQKQNGKTKCVPFKARFVTKDSLIGFGTADNPNIQIDYITGIGEGTHIGRSTMEVYAYGDTTVPFPALVTSTATFTAANGDKIFATGEGYVELNFANGDLHLTGTATITGGTGRFAGATGSLEADVYGNIFKPEGTVTYTGTICY